MPEKAKKTDYKSSSISGRSAVADSIVDQKIRAYSNNRLVLRILMWSFVGLGISYLVFIFFQNKNPGYKELLNNGYSLQDPIASSSSGRLVVLSALKDSSYSLFASKDSGQHFVKLGSWKMHEYLSGLYVAPDDKTIIATLDSSIYYAKFGSDSIQQLQFAGPLTKFSISGIYFDPKASSMYVYGDTSYIREINLYDMKQTLHNTHANYRIRSLAAGNGQWRALASENGNSNYYLLEGTSLDNLQTIPLPNFADSVNYNGSHNIRLMDTIPKK